MATIEERLMALEQGQAGLKKEQSEIKNALELHGIALGALVDRGMLQMVNEKNDKIFQALINHDEFTNMQLAEARGQLTMLDGKIVGLQTETRQRFEQQQATLDGINTRLDRQEVAANARFEQQQATLDGINTRLDRQEVATNARFEQQQATIDARFEQQQATIDARFEQQQAAIDVRFEQQQAAIDARFDQIVHLLTARAFDSQRGLQK
jgi:chaperonin cofactor prefoldin